MIDEAEQPLPTNRLHDESDTDEAWPADQAAFDELVQNAKSLKEHAGTAARSADGALTTARATHLAIERIAKHWDRRAELREHRDELAEERPAVDAKDIKAAEKAVTEAPEAEAKTHEAHQLLVNSAIELRVRSETTGQAAADLRAGIVEVIGDIDPAAAVADIDVVAGAVTTLAGTTRDRSTAETVFETTTATLATQLAPSPFATPDEARDALRRPEDREEMLQRIEAHDNASRDVERDLEADDLRDLPDERPDTTASAEIVTDAKNVSAAADAHRTRTADTHKDISGWSATHR